MLLGCKLVQTLDFLCELFARWPFPPREILRRRSCWSPCSLVHVNRKLSPQWGGIQKSGRQRNCGCIFDFITFLGRTHKTRSSRDPPKRIQFDWIECVWSRRSDVVWFRVAICPAKRFPPIEMPPPVVRNHVERQTDVWAPIQLHFKLCDALGLGSQFADTDTDTNTDSNWDWVKKGTTHGTQPVEEWNRNLLNI